MNKTKPSPFDSAHARLTAAAERHAILQNKCNAFRQKADGALQRLEDADKQSMHMLKECQGGHASLDALASALELARKAQEDALSAIADLWDVGNEMAEHDKNFQNAREAYLNESVLVDFPKIH